MCECVCLLIGACGRRCHCLCVNVYLACRTIVGKQSEDPRSCWKEMIGFRTRWPLCDRWLGAGHAELKSPTYTYVGLEKLAREHAMRKACRMSIRALTYMYACGNTYREFVFIYKHILYNNNRESLSCMILYLQKPYMRTK